MTKRVMFDLTTLFNWNGSPVGIIRVEISLAKHFMEHHSPKSSVSFCRYDKEKALFFEVTQQELLYKIDQIESPAIVDNSITHYTSEQARPLDLSLFNVYLSAGFDWMDKDVVLHKKILKEKNIKIVRFTYDLVPFITPHFLVPNYLAMKLNYFPLLIENSDALICISESTQRDLNEYLKGFPPSVRPQTYTIPLGTEIKSLQGLPPPFLNTQEPFFLFVGTYDARKNIDLLYLVWMRLFRKNPKSCPRLVLVGKLGGYASDLIYKMSHHPELNKKFTFTGATDEQLTWCYQNARALLFPSFYEGWGLPITEALYYHCPVLAANNSSLPEAAQGAAIHLDELDPMAWEHEIEKMLDDSYRKKCIEKTKSFSLISWKQVACRLEEILNQV